MSVQPFRTWLRILDVARWAPSPHNIQPWRVKVLSDTQAELYYDAARLLPDTDPSGAFMTVGFAMFIECLAIAARAEGYALTLGDKVEFTDPKQTGLVRSATLTLSAEAAAAEQAAAELIRSRRTSRLPYDGRPVEPAVVEELRGLAAQYGHTFAATSDPAMVSWTLLLNRDTLFYDLAIPEVREELQLWVRISDAAARRGKDGLWAHCMGLPGALMGIFFSQPWLFTLPGIKQFVQHYYLGTMRGTRTVAWIQGPFTEPADWLSAGRMLMRLWLRMAGHGIYLHPFGSIITNPTAHQRLRDRLQVDESERMVWLIVRLGYSAQPPRSLRRSVEEILLD